MLVASCVGAVEIFPDYTKQRVRFDAAGTQLYGTLVLPDDADRPAPVAIFVHGDGALTHDAYGYYTPIWGALAERGIASFSWDKPGTGGSEGDWLQQDMDDRAVEVVAAYRFLERSGQIDPSRVGLIGFSQAGWVLPRLADRAWIDYLVFVSPAVNVIEQGAYATRERLAAEGVDNAAFEARAMARYRRMVALLHDDQVDYATYREVLGAYEDAGHRDPVSEARFHFERRLVDEDAVADLERIDVPVLALFGSEDRNVDVSDSVAHYRQIFDGKPQVDLQLHVFPDATHQLTKSGYFNDQTPGLLDVLRINLLGDSVFADGMLETLGEFALTQSSP